jgi:hypothetical protein
LLVRGLKFGCRDSRRREGGLTVGVRGFRALDKGKKKKEKWELFGWGMIGGWVDGWMDQLVPLGRGEES